MRLVFTEPARRDLADAFAFIAADNSAAAERQEARVLRAAWSLLEFPKLGRAAERTGERRLDMRGTPFRLVYRQSGDAIIILRVWHGARQWPPASG